MKIAIRAIPVALLLCSTPTRAADLVVFDLVGDFDVRAEAGAVTLLLRSNLAAAKVSLPSRDKLLAAITAMGSSPRYALVIEPSKQAALQAQLKAKLLLAGTVTRAGSGLRATLRLWDATKKEPPRKLTARAPHGQVLHLAMTLGRQLAGLLKRPADQLSSKGAELGALLPFVRAHHGLLSDAKEGGRDIQAALATVGTSLQSATAIARAVGSNPTVKTHQRTLGALAAGDKALALQIARDATKRARTANERRSAAAATALAHAGAGEISAAEKALRAIGKTRLPIERYARAVILWKQKKSKRAAAELLRILSEGPHIPTLRLVSEAPPNAIPPKLLRAALDACKKIDVNRFEPIVSAIAIRAGLRVKQLRIPLKTALGSLRVRTLDSSWIPRLEPLVDKLAKAEDPTGLRLRAEIALCRGDAEQARSALKSALAKNPNDLHARLLMARVLNEAGDHKAAARHLEIAVGDGRPETKMEYARTLDLSGDKKKAEAVYRSLKEDIAAGQAMATARSLARAPSAVARGLDQQAIEALADALAPLLDAFKPLKSGFGSKIAIAPHSGNKWPFYLPRVTHPDRLQAGLQLALQRRHFAIGLRTEPVTKIEMKALTAMLASSDADAVLVYRLGSGITATVDVELIYYAAGAKGALEYDKSIGNGDRYGLVSWNPLLAYFGLGILLLVAGRFAIRLLRGSGDVRVKVKIDRATERVALAFHLTKSETPPSIRGPEAWSNRVLSGTTRTSRTSAIGLHSMARLQRVPTGTYFGHLIGTFVKEGELQLLPSTFTEKVVVRRGDTTALEFDLEPDCFELRVRVFDGTMPVRGARVWLDNETRQTTTRAKGEALISVPRHTPHTVHVLADGLEIDREVRFDDTKTHDLSINLVKERKMLKLRGGIDLDPAAAGAMHQVATTNEQPEPPPRADAVAAQLQPQAPLPPAGQEATLAMWKQQQAQRPAPASPQPPDVEATIPAAATKSNDGLQRYQRIAELGRGAMGVVYKARDTVLERDVALKVIGEELRQHPTVQKMFLQEAKALAALNHPNIVTVFDQGQDEAFTFMVMEFVEGQTLEQVIEKGGPLPLAQGLAVAEQLCAGLSYAHKRKILHRDIKPDNIFISADGVVKIGDFGLARVLHKLSIQRTEIRGTPLYMAPEQIRGTDIDFRADIYALGCTLFAIFTGRPPFVEGEILYHHLHTNPPRPSKIAPNVSPPLEALLLQSIAKDKQHRQPSTEIMREQLKLVAKQVD